MADTKFTYHGPISGVTLREGTGKSATSREVMFADGQTYGLPAEHPYVKRLTAQGRLQPVTAAAKDQPKKSPTTTVNSDGAGGATNKGAV